MPQIGQAQSGTLKSIPKLTRINGDDNLKVVYRNMGNNHAYPFVWANNITVASGETETTIASGVKFHGYELASYGTINVTPGFSAGALYITKDTVANTIVCTTASGPTVSGGGKLDVMFMLGDNPEINGIYCRGNTGAMPNYP